MNVYARFSFAAIAALALASAPLAAQSAGQLLDSLTAVATAPASDTASASADTSVARGPSIASARVASHAVSTKSHAAPPVIQNRSSNRNAVALMIVGGAALVVGAVISGDAGTLVMLGGAGIGLYGLYLFLT